MDGRREIVTAPIDDRDQGQGDAWFPAGQERTRVVGETAMRRLGASLATRLRGGDVLLLHGDLGAGKTTLVQGIATGLSIPDPVQSPTFGLVAEYQGRTSGGSEVRFFHLDLYRLTDPAELEGIGFEQYASPDDGITAIEWPERAIGWLPQRFLLLSITHDGPDARSVTIRAMAHAGSAVR